MNSLVTESSPVLLAVWILHPPICFVKYIGVPCKNAPTLIEDLKNKIKEEMNALSLLTLHCYSILHRIPSIGIHIKKVESGN